MVGKCGGSGTKLNRGVFCVYTCSSDLAVLRAFAYSGMTILGFNATHATVGVAYETALSGTFHPPFNDIAVMWRTVTYWLPHPPDQREL